MSLTLLETDELESLRTEQRKIPHIVHGLTVQYVLEDRAIGEVTVGRGCQRSDHRTEVAFEGRDARSGCDGRSVAQRLVRRRTRSSVLCFLCAPPSLEKTRGREVHVSPYCTLCY